LSANIAPFNPQRLMAEGASDNIATSEDVPPTEPDAEVSFVMHDLAPMMPGLKIALHAPQDEIIARVHDAAELSRKIANNVPDTASITRIKLAYAAHPADNDPYDGFGARIVPENVTLLPKTTNQTTGGNPFNEKLIVANKGDNIVSILRDLD